MFSVIRSIDIDFAHHVRGHDGPCVNIHGHTWKFEVGLEAETLDSTGFVIDFHKLIAQVLQPCHDLLDHGLAVGADGFDAARAQLTALGKQFVPADRQGGQAPVVLGGARSEFPGGLRVIVFPFDPTSERLAHWLFKLAEAELAEKHVQVSFARVYETLHPVESIAEYRP